MNPSTSRFTLDLQETQSQVSVPVKLDDTARVWLITLSDGGLPYVFERGVVAKISIRRPTEELFESTCTIDLNQNRVKYDFNENEYTRETATVPGIHACQITLFDGFDDNAIKLGTAAFTMVVHDIGIIQDIELPDHATTKLAEIDTAEAIRQGNELIRIANEERREAAYEAYLRTIPRIVDITLLASAWVSEEDYYTQVVTIEGVTENTKVDLQPSAEQLAIFHDKDIAFVTENDGGEVTVFAIGEKPTQNYTIQATLKEVSA